MSYNKQISLSAYAESLSNAAKTRYVEKITPLGVDPHLVSPNETKSALDCGDTELPDVGYPDVYHYLINTPGGYTGQALKAYKNLDAYRNFKSGWVRNILVHIRTQRFIIYSQVMRSQRINEMPLKLDVWMAAEQDGVIVCAHCICMAGLGEVCSHVAATLFAVENLVKMKKDVSCTSLPNSCLAPSNSSGCSLTPMPVSEMDLSNAKKRRKLVGSGIDTKKCAKVPMATEAERKTFYDGLKSAGGKSVILSVMPEYNKDFKTYSSLGLPSPLVQLYREEFSSLEYGDLIEKCEETFFNMSISSEEATALEQETREQSSSKIWFRHSGGRITASNMKAATCTNPDNMDKPSNSLIKRICYPESYRFSTNATRWGCQHEKVARDLYTEHQRKNHPEFTVFDAGLFINPQYPHLGASPDGVVKCTCCGEGLVEVICPHCLAEKNICDLDKNKSFGLGKNDSGMLQLKRDHKYYFQVQTQLYVCEKQYCDFVVWGEGFFDIERVVPDSDFWEVCVQKSSAFYLKGVLPEILAKWFTLHRQSSDAGKHVTVLEACCYCRQKEEGVMLECKSSFCKIKKFHFSCLKFKNVPKKTWSCLDCKKVSKNTKN